MDIEYLVDSFFFQYSVLCHPTPIWLLASDEKSAANIGDPL